MNTRRIAAFLATLFFVVAASSNASADDFIAEARIHTAYAHDSSFDAIRPGNALASGQLGVGWQLQSVVQGLRAFALYQPTLPSRIETDVFENAARLTWGMHRFMAAADWGPELWGFFRPFARVAVGYSLQSLKVESSGVEPMRDWAHDFAAQASGGLEIFVPFGLTGLDQQPSVGLSSQVGYAWQTAATFDELHARDDAYDDDFEDDYEEDPFDRQTASFGTMNTNGVFWDLGLQFRLRF